MLDNGSAAHRVEISIFSSGFSGFYWMSGAVVFSFIMATPGFCSSRSADNSLITRI